MSVDRLVGVRSVYHTTKRQSWKRCNVNIYAHFEGFQLLFGLHLLHRNLEPDMLLFPRQKLSFCRLLFLLVWMCVQGLDGTLALFQRNMRIYESVFCLGHCGGRTSSVFKDSRSNIFRYLQKSGVWVYLRKWLLFSRSKSSSSRVLLWFSNKARSLTSRTFQISAWSWSMIIPRRKGEIWTISYQTSAQLVDEIRRNCICLVPKLPSSVLLASSSKLAVSRKLLAVRCPSRRARCSLWGPRTYTALHIPQGHPGYRMAVTASAQSALPLTWDETIVPALRKRKFQFCGASSVGYLAKGWFKKREGSSWTVVHGRIHRGSPRDPRHLETIRDDFVLNFTILTTIQLNKNCHD